MEKPFTPDWYSPPGDTISTILEEKRITVQLFGELMGCDAALIDRLLKGAEPLTEAIAAKLEVVLGSTKEFWLRREQTYRKDKARLEGE